MFNINGDISDWKGHRTGTEVNSSNFMGSLQCVGSLFVANQWYLSLWFEKYLIPSVRLEWTWLSQPPLFLLFHSYHKTYFCCKKITFIWNQQINPRNFCRLRFICYFIANFRATLCHESVMPVLMLLDSKNAD